MKMILEISGSGDDETILHRIVEEFPVTLGRGYHNDIILSDPHVGEQHLRIDYDGVCWTLTDLGSVNPTLLNAKTCFSTTAKLVSGDILRLGSTTLRIFAPDHPIEAPVLIQKAGRAFLLLMRPLNVWSFFALAIAGITGWTYTSLWSDQKGLMLTIAGAITAGIIFVWAALWSVAGRLIRRKSFFRAHLALISLYLILGTLAAWVSGALSFLTNESTLSLATGYALSAALLALLLYGSLSLATHMKATKRLMAALIFSGGLALGAFAVSFIVGGKFNPDPLYPYHLQPFLGKIAPAGTIDEFMAGNDDLFKSDVFDRKKD
jgi:hypothetical protein